MTMRTLNQLLGPLDPVWDECRLRSKPLTMRRGDEIFKVFHHSVSRTLQSIESTFKSPNRSVSATSGVGPTVAGVDAYRAKQYVPWDKWRPYTTASWVDDVAITSEMANLRLAHPYPVGMTGKRWGAEVIAAMHVELKMPLDRWHVTCHREVHQRGWGSYATACPGDDLHAALDWMVAEARKIVADNGTGGNELKAAYHSEDKLARKSGRIVKPGGQFYLHISNTDPKNTSNASNIIGTTGQYSITPHVYAEGLPGDVLEVQLLWDQTKTSGPHSGHYTERMVFDKNGRINRSVEFKRIVVSGIAVYLKLASPLTNSKDAKVTVLDADAFAYEIPK